MTGGLAQMRGYRSSVQLKKGMTRTKRHDTAEDMLEDETATKEMRLTRMDE
jgi:hypothetical protein